MYEGGVTRILRKRFKMLTVKQTRVDEKYGLTLSNNYDFYRSLGDQNFMKILNINEKLTVRRRCRHEYFIVSSGKFNHQFWCKEASKVTLQCLP